MSKPESRDPVQQAQTARIVAAAISGFGFAWSLVILVLLIVLKMYPSTPQGTGIGNDIGRGIGDGAIWFCAMVFGVPGALICLIGFVLGVCRCGATLAWTLGLIGFAINAVNLLVLSRILHR